MNIFSFFSGAGFLDLGFEATGNYEVVYVNEFHKSFNDVYKHARERMGIANPRFGHHVEDITLLLNEEHMNQLIGKVILHFQALVKLKQRNQNIWPQHANEIPKPKK